MLNFASLPEDGVLFEQLVRELLLRQGFEVHWTGVGADGGRDLIVHERCVGPIADFARKWLVSCKHLARSGRSVGVDEVANITDACRAVDAEGFLLACSTQPTAALVRRLEEFQSSQGLLTKFWDGVEIERRLSTPETLPLLHRFFPEDATRLGWTIYNAQSPALWAGNYKGYFLYLSSRDAHAFPALTHVEAILARLEAVPLPDPPPVDEWEVDLHRHALRPRAVHFDNKHGVFSVFVDYLVPDHGDPSKVVSPRDVNRVLRDGEGLYRDEHGETFVTFWDVRPVKVSRVSDHFNEDHKDFYVPYMRNYEIGHARASWRLDELPDWPVGL